ncbi:MAG: aminoglycoside N(3)-acetyltransferase [Candidatus Promineifilaceae bacterium]
MTEADSIARVKEPGTRESLAADFRRLGLFPGQVVLVHGALSSLGWVSGGAVAVLWSLMDVLTPEGTLVMPAHSGDYSDPAQWQHPPVPETWQETIRATMPLYDPRRTPTRGMGRIAELFRTWPDVLRSDHPQLSFAAWGKEANFVTAGHELAYALGERSPLARIYDLNGDVLLIGVGHDNNTSLHLSEVRAPNPQLIETSAPWLEDGVRVWKCFPDIDYDEQRFPELGVAFEAAYEVTTGQVAAAACRLMSQRALVDFGVEWLTAHAEEL